MTSIKDHFFSAIGFVLRMHILGLLFLSLFRVMQFIALHQMVADSHSSVFPAFLRGLWFDNVVGCYILIFPLLLVMVDALFNYYSNRLKLVATLWTSALYLLVFAISAGNIPYFQYFFKNINSGIFEWFGYAGTTTGMIFGEKSYLIYIALFTIASAGFVWLLCKNYQLAVRHTAIQQKQRRSIGRIGFELTTTVLLIGACLFGIRGRMGYNPIKISEAYYCNDPFLNQLGISPAFNLLTSVLDDMRSENKELHLMDYTTALSSARSSLGISGRMDSTHVLLRHIKGDTVVKRKPNVVVILMESMSADFLQTFGQKQRVTPTLDSLYQHALAFTHFYSAGIHTNHGLMASLYSFPALMSRNLMKGTVTPKRNGIPTVLKSRGYRNLFFMTHEAQYDNMNAFFRTNGYDEVYSQEDYPASEVVNSFGVSDHFLFNYALHKLNKLSHSGNPFMATLLTVSNHPPYVIPPFFHPTVKGEEYAIAEYADWALGQFLYEAKKQPWYRNTVFVVLADHGKIVGKVDAELPQSYNHIPLLIWGAGIKPQRCDGLAMQVDVMPTLLALLGADYDFEGFGVNLLTHNRDKVFYSADNQLVARDKQRCFIYNPGTRQQICYDALPNGALRKSNNESRFTALRNYSFAMTQTAEYLLRHP